LAAAATAGAAGAGAAGRAGATLGCGAGGALAAPADLCGARPDSGAFGSQLRFFSACEASCSALR
jgi:hypothetical protein